MGRDRKGNVFNAIAVPNTLFAGTLKHILWRSSEDVLSS